MCKSHKIRMTIKKIVSIDLVINQNRFSAITSSEILDTKRIVNCFALLYLFQYHVRFIPNHIRVCFMTRLNHTISSQNRPKITTNIWRVMERKKKYGNVNTLLHAIWNINWFGGHNFVPVTIYLPLTNTVSSIPQNIGSNYIPYKFEIWRYIQFDYCN